MSLEQDFNTAAENVKKLKAKPTDQELLEIYALYKQATVGDVTGDRPGMFDLKGKAKYDTWAKRKGMSKEEAMKAYIDKAQVLVETYGLA